MAQQQVTQKLTEPEHSINFTAFCTMPSHSASSDFVSTTYDVTFEAGSYVTTVAVPVVDDTLGEIAETFYGSLMVVGTSTVQVTEDRADILIIDDDSEQDKIFKCVVLKILLDL